MRSDIFPNFPTGDVPGRNPATASLAEGFYSVQRSVAPSAASAACVGKATART